MNDKAKTPKRLAEEFFDAIPLVDAIKKHLPEVYEKSLFWFTEGYLVAHHARDKEVADLEQQLELATEVHHYTPGGD